MYEDDLYRINLVKSLMVLMIVQSFHDDDQMEVDRLLNSADMNTPLTKAGKNIDNELKLFLFPHFSQICSFDYFTFVRSITCYINQ